MTSRRKFLHHCSIVATIAAVPAGFGVFSPARTPEVSLDQLDFEAFSGLVGTQFNVRQSLASIRLELVEVSEGGSLVPQSSKGQQRNPGQFSLIFRGTKEQSLGQNTYPFEHEKIGPFAMFIVPVRSANTAKGSYYQAVFNRPTGLAMQAALKARPQKSPRLQAMNLKREQTRRG